MPITVEEDGKNSRVGWKEDEGGDLVYVVEGSDEQEEIIAAVRSVTGLFYQGFGRGLIKITEQIAPGTYRVEVPYRFGNNPDGKYASEWSVSSTGGTAHITTSIQTVQSYGPAPRPNYQGGIGVTKDAVEGVDIIVPQFLRTETHWWYREAITQGYIQSLFAATGKVNSQPFREMSAGEALFLGFTWDGRGGLEPWRFTYSFMGLPNVTNKTVGTITGINKRGHEYLWVSFEEVVDNNKVVKRPKYAYVERVYESTDFGAFGIGTGWPI